MAALRRLASLRDTHVAVISGRSLRDLEEQLAESTQTIFESRRKTEWLEARVQDLLDAAQGRQVRRAVARAAGRARPARLAGGEVGDPHQRVVMPELHVDLGQQIAGGYGVGSQIRLALQLFDGRLELFLCGIALAKFVQQFAQVAAGRRQSHPVLGNVRVLCAESPEGLERRRLAGGDAALHLEPQHGAVA